MKINNLNIIINYSGNLGGRIEKAHKDTYACNRLMGDKFDLTPVITQWIYTTIIRPLLFYSVKVWSLVVEK